MLDSSVKGSFGRAAGADLLQTQTELLNQKILYTHPRTNTGYWKIITEAEEGKNRYLFEQYENRDFFLNVF